METRLSTKHFKKEFQKVKHKVLNRKHAAWSNKNVCLMLSN